MPHHRPSNKSPEKWTCAFPQEECSPVSMVTFYATGILDWNGLLPVVQPNSFIHCQSVFSSTKWVQRPLTLGKLLTAFDVPSPVCPEDIVQDVSTKRVIKFQSSWAFQVSPPLKVLHRALEVWLPYTNITYLP